MADKEIFRPLKTRREFLPFLALGGVAALTAIPRPNLFPLPREEPLDQYRDKLAASNLLGFAHNAANEKEIFELFLKSNIKNVEVDIQQKNGVLYVAHHTREMHSLRWIQPESIDAEIILASITLQGINPHFDLKSSVANPVGTRLFRELMEDEKKVPPHLEVTISSQQWPLITSLLGSKRPHRSLFTIEDWRKLPRFQEFLENLDTPWENIGISLKNNLATREVVEHFSNLGLQVVVWTVDWPKRALELSSWGARGITSDKPQLLEALNPK